MKNKSLSSPPIFVVGLPRSGTTLVSELLGSHPDVSMLIEPHALWKAGDFKHLDDGDRIPNAVDVEWIRSAMGRFAQGRVLVEKSPVNCLRVERVFATFPNARIIYLNRDPAACVYSNWLRTEKKDAFKLSIIIKKYLGRSGDERMPNARSWFPLWRQVRPRDYGPFLFYVCRMFLSRGKGLLPFGPRLVGFENLLKEKGSEEYHWDVWAVAQQCKVEYARLYGERFKSFSLESLVNSPDEFLSMLQHAGLSLDEEFLKEAVAKVSEKRLAQNEVPERFKQRLKSESRVEDV